MPEISVIMGIYNQFDKEALFSAVNSILSQSFRDFEFIIYDDGSHPEAAKYLAEVKELDERIVLIGREENNGLAFSLNECIDKTKGHYIARMDADDISLVNRLQIQKDFLDSHPEYSWCGTNAELFDEKEVWGYRRMPEKPALSDFLKFSPYMHPTVMFRREILIDANGYKVSELTTRCEDYELFMRLTKDGLQGYNIQEKLYQYREDNAEYAKRKLKYRYNEAVIRYKNFKKLGILWPFGWISVLRPLVAALLPDFLIAFWKRKESGYEKKNSKTSLSTADTSCTADSLWRGLESVDR